jgi:sporulation protein YlmC with PRC-barrel domain
MANNQATCKWSELYKADVVIPDEGKIIGHVEDFFFKENSHNIYALSVRTRVHGDLTIPVTGIKSIDGKRVNLINAQMVEKAVPPFTRGQSLLTRRVVSENGTEFGIVKDIVFSLSPIVAMRVESFEIARGDSGQRTSGVSSEAAVRFEDDTVVIKDAVAKKLH